MREKRIASVRDLDAFSLFNSGLGQFSQNTCYSGFPYALGFVCLPSGAPVPDHCSPLTKATLALFPLGLLTRDIAFTTFIHAIQHQSLNLIKQISKVIHKTTGPQFQGARIGLHFGMKLACLF